MSSIVQPADDFIWGVSTAAYQIEGGHNCDGKGRSIWDEFTSQKGKIYQGENADVACDYYHRYAHDLGLMSQLGIKNYRFSISWSRILPSGTGAVNHKGVDFYNKVINFCLELGIEPWVTLYHWDLPQELERKGGWTNRQVIGWFSEYVQLCVRLFGDRVRHWMVLNEPMVFTGAGYFLGVHAPGRKGLSSFLSAAHHAAMCQAEGGRIIKSHSAALNVGTTFSCSYIEPYRKNVNDQRAATRVDALLNRLFVEPLAGLGYPVKDLGLLNRMSPYVKDGDEAKLSFKMDFIGVQNYTRELVAWSYLTPFIWAKLVKASKRNVPLTEMGWEVYPGCIYEMLHQFNGYQLFDEILVTENGAAFPDTVDNNTVNDVKRVDYLQQHIAQVMRARSEGVKVNGYFVWSFTDNFEWAEGYKPRFGLVYIDFKTQRRIPKASAYWYGELIKSRQLQAALSNSF